MKLITHFLGGELARRMLQSVQSGRATEWTRKRCVSRREFLAASAGMVLSGSWPSIHDDMISAREHDSSYVEPQTGEVLPKDGPFSSWQDDMGFQSCNPRDLFLTFDDGPLDCTSHILDILGEMGHKATFFVIGRNLKNSKLRRLAVRALREGHDIGNHSYSHPNFSEISTDRAIREIWTTHTLIQEVVAEAGVDPNRQDLFFRFPGGDGGNSWNYRPIHETLDKLNYGIAWWDLDTNDWRMDLRWYPRSPSRVIQTLSKARPHDVVLMHDRVKTARYLPEMLQILETQQLASTTLSDIELGPRVQTAGTWIDRILGPSDPTQTDSSSSISEWILDSLFPDRYTGTGQQGSMSNGDTAAKSNLW
jgi:peptidoglycan/xylan/chitin deacetylase (PgdA/CDA1 family)